MLLPGKELEFNGKLLLQSEFKRQFTKNLLRLIHAGEGIFNTLQMNSKAKNKPKRLKIL